MALVMPWGRCDLRHTSHLPVAKEEDDMDEESICSSEINGGSRSKRKAKKSKGKKKAKSGGTNLGEAEPEAPPADAELVSVPPA